MDNLEGLDIIVSDNVPPSPTPPPPLPPQINMESKSLQTDEYDTQPQVAFYKCSLGLLFTNGAIIFADVSEDSSACYRERCHYSKRT